MFPLRQLPGRGFLQIRLSSPQLWLLRNCSHLSLMGKGSGLFKACFLGTWRAGNWASMRRWSCRVSSHGPCSVTALLREKLQFWFPKARDSCYSNWFVPFPRLPPVLHPGTKGHGQTCGGLVTVRYGSIFGCGLRGCRSWTGQCLAGGTGHGAQEWWASGAGRAGRARALAGPVGRGGGEWPLSGPLDSVSSLEHCRAVSGLCPLALGCIALCLQL